ncbi:MAG: DUF2892 domain-containing protein [Balneolales bacterium]|nr:DUF2892 domain-containing protein [Balneolales bacterium]
MKKNVGTTDKVIRISLAIVLLILFFTNVLTGVAGIIAIIASVVLIGTSLFSFCGLYTLFGTNTCSIEEQKPAN